MRRRLFCFNDIADCRFCLKCVCVCVCFWNTQKLRSWRLKLLGCDAVYFGRTLLNFGVNCCWHFQENRSLLFAERDGLKDWGGNQNNMNTAAKLQNLVLNGEGRDRAGCPVTVPAVRIGRCREMWLLLWQNELCLECKVGGDKPLLLERGWKCICIELIVYSCGCGMEWVGRVTCLAEKKVVKPLRPSGHYMYRPAITICTAQRSLYVQPI